MNQKNIESFLKFGYYLDYENPYVKLDFSKVNKDKYKDKTIEELIYEGKKLFLNAINKLFSVNKKHVVPLSGGLDSRAILAALLEFTEASNIHTYTFGTPGTLDYEIGNQIAEIIGTKHVEFPLINHKYNMEEQLNISKRVDYQTVLFHHPPIWQLDELYSDYMIWSGFFAGSLIGERYIENGPTNVIDAKKWYLKNNNYQMDINLNSVKDNSFMELLDIKYENENKASTLELLNFYNRQIKFIAPHVLIDGYNYNIPFLDQKLINFFLSIDNKYRKNQLLYKRILLESFPKIFSYPTKNNFGLPLDSPTSIVILKKITYKIKRIISKNNNPYINYLDFDRKIREKNDLKEIIRENIYDLYNRKIIEWIDVREVYQNHINKKGNYGKALLLLSSLEIHMKAKELNSRNIEKY